MGCWVVHGTGPAHRERPTHAAVGRSGSGERGQASVLQPPTEPRPPRPLPAASRQPCGRHLLRRSQVSNPTPSSADTGQPQSYNIYVPPGDASGSGFHKFLA